MISVNGIDDASLLPGESNVFTAVHTQLQLQLRVTS
jgi:hypothetical protein